MPRIANNTDAILKDLIGRLEKLVEAGYFVHFSYLESEEAAADITLDLGQDRVRATRCDGTRLDDVKSFVEAAFDRDNGRVEVLVNNAGITRDQALMLMDPADWQAVIETNLTGVFNFCRAAAMHFFRQKSGRVCGHLNR